MSPRALCFLLAGRVASVVVAGAAALSMAGTPAGAAAADGAPWTLVQDRSDHSCPLTLHFDAAGAAGVLAMPAGCRRAVPGITAARSWSIDGNSAIQLRDATGQSLLTLARQSDGAWHGDDESGHSYTLTPPSAAAARTAGPADMSDPGPIALANPQVIAPDPDATLDRSVIRLAATAAKPASAVAESAAAGRYAVMRGDRDTGCMVTLESGKGKARARLAPACRDQGITIFDPVSWQMKGSDLMLTARKGHSIDLAKDENGIWIKLPKDVKALGLKPL